MALIATSKPWPPCNLFGHVAQRSRPFGRHRMRKISDLERRRHCDCRSAAGKTADGTPVLDVGGEWMDMLTERLLEEARPSARASGVDRLTEL